MPRRASATVALVVVLLLALAAPALAQGQAQRGGPIRLKAATFNPSKGERPTVPPGLARATPQAGQRAYYIVQFAGPVEQAWKDEVAALGVELLDYIPDYAFKARMTPELANRVSRLSSVVYADVFHPLYAVSPELGQGEQLVRVRVERGGNAQAVANAASAAGAAVSQIAPNSLVVAANGAQIQRIAQALDTAWIEPYRLNEKHNEFGGGGIIGGNTVNASGYDGSSQIAAVADTGIGGGTASTAHRDIPSARVQAIQNFPGVTDFCFQTITDDGAVDVDSGHGTHVAGSVLSGGNTSGQGKGVAPAAKLVFQAIENYVSVSNYCRNNFGYTNDYYLTGLDNLTNVFQQAYNAGARIHANSWGSAAAGDYTQNSVDADAFIWNNRDFTITFSAGNEGIDANADGVIDNDSIGAPATAKNVITIGASENERPSFPCDTGLTYQSRDAYQPSTTCSGMGGNNILGTYGVRWPADYPANPIASDPSGGNQQQMAAFSSRGPTDDGRIKPDVVAPGTWILSTYSSEHQEGYGDPTNPRTGAYQSDGWGMPIDSFYKYFGGTSMSNPIAAGAATVVRDYYQKAKSHSASAALVKATLINTAVDLADENNDGANDNDFPIPNVHEGWGRVDLVAATNPGNQYVDNTAGLSTGASAGYSFSVPSGASSFKVSVVWSDAPSTATATANLVNNLNLTVTSPGGVTYRGNVFSGGWSAAGGSADTINNVENVYVQAPAAGTWTVTVSGANVPQGPQPFALVVSTGATGGTTPTATPSTTTPSPTPVVTPSPTPVSNLPAAPSSLRVTGTTRNQASLAWTDNSSNETGFRIEICTGSTCTNFSEVGTVGANTTAVNVSGLTRNTTYRFRIRAYNASGNSAYSNIVNATTTR